MDIKTPLRTLVKISDGNGWAAGVTGIYLGYTAGYDTVKVGFVDENGEFTGESTKVRRSAVSVVETPEPAAAKPVAKRKPAKTPTTAIARILKDMGLKQGSTGDFCVRGFHRNGERVGTMVVLYNRKANNLVDKEADEIERLSEEAGFHFHVSTRYHHLSKDAYPDLSNFGERVRRPRPVTEGADKPATSGTRVRAIVRLSGKRNVSPTLWIEGPAAVVATRYLSDSSVPVADAALKECGYRRTGEWAPARNCSATLLADVVADK